MLRRKPAQILRPVAGAAESDRRAQEAEKGVGCEQVQGEGRQSAEPGWQRRAELKLMADGHSAESHIEEEGEIRDSAMYAPMRGCGLLISRGCVVARWLRERMSNFLLLQIQLNRGPAAACYNNAAIFRSQHWTRGLLLRGPV